MVGSLLYEGLFRLDEQLQPQPCLCQSYTYDPAALTYTFTLRSGVTFSDGSPLTAADAAAVLWRAKSSQRYGARLSNAADFSAGDGTLTVTLSSPDTGFPALLDIPIVKSGTEGSLVPVGTGPYVLSTAGEGAGLTARADWWGGGGQPAERIALAEARDRDAMLYLFSSHDVQLITADLIGTDPITATGNISYRDADTTVLHYVGFNVRRAPFSDIAVRRALALASTGPRWPARCSPDTPGPLSSRCRPSPRSIPTSWRRSTPTTASPRPWPPPASPPASPGPRRCW